MKLCFVIMPIGSGDAYEIYFNRYLNIIKPAVENYQMENSLVFDVIRADFITKTGSITKSVIQHIYNADLVIADLTDPNPNVFYELGVRHALRNGTILVALEGTKLPFDVGDLRSVFFKDRVGAEKEAVPAIQRLIHALTEAESPDDSPVFAVLPTLREPETRAFLEARAKASAAESDAAELRVKLALAEEGNLRLREAFTTFERTINTVLDRLKPEDREAATKAVERARETRTDSPRREVIHMPLFEENPTEVFLLMPFSKELDPIFTIIREAASSVGLRATRADRMITPGSITDQIAEAIARAGLIVADITGSNANVLFELGMAISLGKNTLIISQDRDNIPFDIAHRRVLFYENTILGSHHLRNQLQSAMREIVKKSNRNAIPEISSN